MSQTGNVGDKAMPGLCMCIYLTVLAHMEGSKYFVKAAYDDLNLHY